MPKVKEVADKLTATEYNKEDIKALRAALKAQKKPGACAQCSDCGECRADVVLRKIRRANSKITRVEHRVQVMLEKALAT